MSICIPVYGVEQYIERCADSLFEQTYNNLEFVFVNDCTKDNSIGVLHSVIERYSNRLSQVQIIEHEHNKGLAGARNTAVDAATGEFVIHVDSDDWVDKRLVERLVEQQLKGDFDIVSSDFLKVFKSRKQSVNEKAYATVDSYRKDVVLHKAGAHIWGRLIRKSLYSDNDIRCEEGINMGEDYHVYARLVYYAKKVDLVSELLYYYNCLNEGSYTNMYSEEKLRQDWRSFDIVKDFYLKQSEDNVNLVQAAELKLIVTDFVFSARYKGIDYYYHEAAKRLHSIDLPIWETQPLAVRVLLHLHRCRSLMNVYANITTSIKHILERLKNKSN